MGCARTATEVAQVHGNINHRSPVAWLGEAVGRHARSGTGVVAALVLSAASLLVSPAQATAPALDAIADAYSVSLGQGGGKLNYFVARRGSAPADDAAVSV